MVKKLREYVNYTAKELESYTATEGSCVRKVNTDLHFSLWPKCLENFKHALLSHIRHRKLGCYDAALNGIVLDIKNIKVLGTTAAIRGDDSRLHVDINADCYIFCPVVGAVLSGVVKHIGNHHIGVIIYRVFNASIRFLAKVNRDEVQMNDTVQFRIKDFNLQHMFPYIDGDLVTHGNVVKTESELNDNTIDSGIEEREVHESEEVGRVIKQEPDFDADVATEKTSKSKKESSGKKRKRKTSETVDEPPVKIKSESKRESKMRKVKNVVEVS